MVKKILIPSDDSQNSNIAIQYGIYLAHRLEAHLTGLHVLDVNLIQGPMLTDISGGIGMPPYDGFFDAVEISLNEKADFILNNFSRQCQNGGLECATKKNIGEIQDVIIEEAQNTDLILMARKGEHFHLKEGSPLGSVAKAVIRNCAKPVMITPTGYREIESMGLAYDGSEPAKKALALSLELSEQAKWPLTTIIVSANATKAAELTLQAENFAEERNIDNEIVVLQGKEDEEIISFIKEGAVELMVMGAYGHNRLRELILGSTTSHVINNSTIPVLLTH